MKSTSISANIIRNSMSILLIAFIILCAEVTGINDFIFPEIGALCVGLWIVNKHVWRVKKWQVPVLFTIGAIAGVGIVRYVPLPLAIQMEIGFFIVALLLMLFNASITPAISACMLPILIGCDSWLYPVVVFSSTLILALGQYTMERLNIRDVADNNIKFSVPESNEKILQRWLALMVILAPILIIGSTSGYKFVMVPPLIVTFVEFSNSASAFRQRPIPIWFTLIIAACIGTFTHGILHLTFGIPQCICAAIAVTVILAIFNHSGKYFAPAVAITLVPMILPATAVPFFPVYVAAGSAYFIFMGMIFVKLPVK